MIQDLKGFLKMMIAKAFENMQARKGTVILKCDIDDALRDVPKDLFNWQGSNMTKDYLHKLITRDTFDEFMTDHMNKKLMDWEVIEAPCTLKELMGEEVEEEEGENVTMIDRNQGSDMDMYGPGGSTGDFKIDDGTMRDMCESYYRRGLEHEMTLRRKNEETIDELLGVVYYKAVINYLCNRYDKNDPSKSMHIAIMMLGGIDELVCFVSEASFWCQEDVLLIDVMYKRRVMRAAGKKGWESEVDVPFALQWKIRGFDAAMETLVSRFGGCTDNALCEIGYDNTRCFVREVEENHKDGFLGGEDKLLEKYIQMAKENTAEVAQINSHKPVDPVGYRTRISYHTRILIRYNHTRMVWLVVPYAYIQLPLFL